jgi:hypothetical protein
MKYPTLQLASTALATALLSACGGNDESSAALPPVPVPQTVDTTQVLSLAEKTSEAASPFPVNGGLVTFSDTSETTLPLSVNGN